MAADLTFTMFVGDTQPLEITFQDENQVPVNLTGLTGDSIIWSLSTTDAVTGSQMLTRNIGNGVTLTDAANGVFEVLIKAIDTAGITPGKYYHEVEVTEADGTVTTVVTGKITFKATLIGFATP